MSQSLKTRVQLDLLTREAQALDMLRDACALRSRADAVRMALAVVEWVRTETSRGKRILAVGGEEIAYLAIPGLTTIPTAVNEDRSTSNE